MKAAVIHQTGPPEVIQIVDLPTPTPADDEVLIEVQVAAVNPIDTYLRSGTVAADLPQPYIIGCDAAGVVSAVGSQARGFAVGDRVWCTNQGLLGRQGTSAQQIAVAARWCYPIPAEVAFADAAAAALVGVTAHLGLFREAKLQAGETLLVVGGSGGIGSMVIQMAKAVGATVIATAGSDQKCELVKRLGADVAINYRNTSITAGALDAAPGGVNVFWETRREPDFDSAVEIMAPRGRMVLMAGRTARPEFPVGPFYVKECSLHGLVMFKATAIEMRHAAQEINRWMAGGKLTATIGATFPLDQAAEAHRLQEAATIAGSADLAGKIVLDVAGR